MQKYLGNIAVILVIFYSGLEAYKKFFKKDSAAQSFKKEKVLKKSEVKKKIAGVRYCIGTVSSELCEHLSSKHQIELSEFEGFRNMKGTLYVTLSKINLFKAVGIPDKIKNKVRLSEVLFLYLLGMNKEFENIKKLLITVVDPGLERGAKVLDSVHIKYNEITPQLKTQLKKALYQSVYFNSTLTYKNLLEALQIN